MPSLPRHPAVRGSSPRLNGVRLAPAGQGWHGVAWRGAGGCEPTHVELGPSIWGLEPDIFLRFTEQASDGNRRGIAVPRLLKCVFAPEDRGVNGCGGRGQRSELRTSEMISSPSEPQNPPAGWKSTFSFNNPPNYTVIIPASCTI